MKTNKEISNALKLLKKRIIKGWGSKCKDFEIGCCVCRQHLALDILNENKYELPLFTYDPYKKK